MESEDREYEEEEEEKEKEKDNQTSLSSSSFLKGTGNNELKPNEINVLVSLIRNDLRKPLEGLTIRSLKLVKDPIILDSELGVKDGMKILVERHIRCAPVRNSKQEFIGVLDIRDSLKYAVQMYRQSRILSNNNNNNSNNNNNNSSGGSGISNHSSNGNNNSSGGSNKTSHDKHKNTDDTSGNSSGFSEWALAPEIMTNKVSYLARMRHFRTLQDNDDVLALLGGLCRGNHLIGVTDNKTKKLLGIISQGDAFQQIATLYTQLKLNVGLNYLHLYGYVKSPVVCIPVNTPAHDAFELMGKHDLSGLAVVNSKQEIVHNTSSTDIKLWLQSSAALDLTIEDFLVKIRSEQIQNMKNQQINTSFPVTYVSMQNTLRTVIDKLQKTKYHRIWVVNEAKYPIGVMSLTDIFKFITSDFKPLFVAQPNQFKSNDDEIDENEEEL